MEDEEDRLVRFGANLLLDELLMLAEQFGMKFDISGLVDTVDIAEASSDGKVW